MTSTKRKGWKIVLILLILLNLGLWATGKLYLYKALVYNYVNIDDIDLFPTRTVKSGPPQPWHEGSDYNRKKLTPLLRETLEKYQSVAFLVIQDDSVRYEEYWDQYGQASLSNSFSMAKSFVGLLIGIALDEGKIKDLNEPVCNYLPEFCEGRDHELTLRHLLMMSSGLNYDEGYASLFGQVTRSYYDTDLRKQMYELHVIAEPGKEYNYMSCNTELLALIIEKATGKSVSEYASEKLWKPMGAEHDAQWSLDREDGVEKAYCCFYSNARDFARVGKLMLNHGNWKGVQLVPAPFIDLCITPAPVLDGGKPNKNYGYHWWITEAGGHPVYYARGILGQYIFTIPDLNLVAVRLGHKRGEKDAGGQLLDVPVYLDEILKMYGSRNPVQPEAVE